MRKLILVAMMLLLAACGTKASTNSKTSATSTPPVSLSGSVNDRGAKDVSGGAPNVSIAQAEFAFTPTFVKVDPGSRVTVALSNGGTVSHTFTIDAVHVDVTLKPGESRSVTFTMPADGLANFYCRFHRSSGMQGAVYSAAGASASPEPSETSSGGQKGYGY